MNKNKLICTIFFICFIIFSLVVKLCPGVTILDKSIIVWVQNTLKEVPLYLPLLPDCKLYSIMIAIPLLAGAIYFSKKREWLKIIFIFSIPLVTFLLNCVIKPLVHRARPPFELQQMIHPHSFSYVSSHSLVTMTLYGMVIYFVYKNCSNRILKYTIITFSVLWISFVGLSRIWLGVHYPTDVLSAYMLGFILCTNYSKINL